MDREAFRQRAIGKYYTSKCNEVGVNEIKENEIKAFEDGAMWAFDLLNKEPQAVRLPLYSVDSNNFKLPESRL